MYDLSFHSNYMSGNGLNSLLSNLVSFVLKEVSSLKIKLNYKYKKFYFKNVLFNLNALH